MTCPTAAGRVAPYTINRAVTTASLLLAVAAPLTALTAVLSFLNDDYGAQTFSNAVDQGLVQDDTGFAAFGVVARLGLVVVGWVIAAVLLALAWRIRAGHQSARVLAWALGGVELLYAGCSSGPAATDDGIAGALSAYPAWFPIVYQTTAVLTAVSLLAALILLATPAVNRFFRQSRTARHHLPADPAAISFLSQYPWAAGAAPSGQGGAPNV